MNKSNKIIRTKFIPTNFFTSSLNLLKPLRLIFMKFCLRESVSKLVCDWEGLGGRGGEEVHDDSIKNKEDKIIKGLRQTRQGKFSR